MIRSNSSSEKFTMMILALSPILQSYAGIGHFNLAETILLLLCVIYLSRNGTSTLTTMPVLLIAYFACWTFGVLLISAITGTTIYPILGPIRSFIVWAFVFYSFNITSFVKYYKIIAVVAIFFFLTQLAVNGLLHIRLSGYIPGLSLNHGLDEADVLSSFQQEGRRFASFFSEPAFFVQYIVLLLPIELYLDKGKSRLLLIFLTIGTLLLANSGNALVSLLAVFVSYLLYLTQKKNVSSKIFGGAVILLLIFVVGIYYFGSEMGQDLLSRQEEITGGVNNNSGFVRVVRGYYILGTFDLPQWLFGINGSELYDRAIHSTPIAWAFEEGDYYFNGFQTIIIRTGLIGLVLLYLFLIKIWKYGTITSRSLLLVYFFTSLVAASFFSFTMCIQIVLAYSLCQFPLSKK